MQPLMAHIVLPGTEIESQQLTDGVAQMHVAMGINGEPADRRAALAHDALDRRAVMAAGHRPTAKAVLEHLGRGSPNHIAESMQRFWKDQTALNAGDPLALSRLPPELADAAVAQFSPSTPKPTRRRVKTSITTITQ
jgi:Plasmid replication region DNA-binding N-term